MRKFFVVCSVIAVLCLCACGEVDQFKDSSLSYKSITGRTGDVHVISADGKPVPGYDYPNATIVYTNANSMTLLIKDREGHEKYIQGFVVIDLH
jgi:hypothetical protein